MVLNVPQVRLSEMPRFDHEHRKPVLLRALLHPEGLSRADRDAGRYSVTGSDDGEGGFAGGFAVFARRSAGRVAPRTFVWPTRVSRWSRSSHTNMHPKPNDLCWVACLGEVTRSG
jgi:hypothetical protein